MESLLYFLILSSEAHVSKIDINLFFCVQKKGYTLMTYCQNGKKNSHIYCQNSKFIAIIEEKIALIYCQNGKVYKPLVLN